jgi:hypothetical protein
VAHGLHYSVAALGVSLRVIPDWGSQLECACWRCRLCKGACVTTSTKTRSSDPLGTRRWQVHLGLIASFGVALFVVIAHTGISVHIVAGLCFAALVSAHLVQRRRTVRALAGSLVEPPTWRSRRGRLALADAVLVFLAANVVLSGIVDWASARPAMVQLLPGLRPLNWHTTSSLLLLVYVIVHVVRRRAKLRHSHIQ